MRVLSAVHSPQEARSVQSERPCLLTFPISEFGLFSRGFLTHPL